MYRPKTPWYSLGENWEPVPLIFPAKVGERFLVFRNQKEIFEDKKLYGVTPLMKKDVDILCGILNSTLTQIFLSIDL